MVQSLLDITEELLILLDGIIMSLEVQDESATRLKTLMLSIRQRVSDLREKAGKK